MEIDHLPFAHDSAEEEVGQLLAAQGNEAERKEHLRQANLYSSAWRRHNERILPQDILDFTLFRSPKVGASETGFVQSIVLDFAQFIYTVYTILSMLVAWVPKVGQLVNFINLCIADLPEGDRQRVQVFFELLDSGASESAEWERWEFIGREASPLMARYGDNIVALPRPYVDLRSAEFYGTELVAYEPDLCRFRRSWRERVILCRDHHTPDMVGKILCWLLSGAVATEENNEEILVSATLMTSLLSKHGHSYWSDAIAARIDSSALLNANINIDENAELRNVRSNTARMVIAVCQFRAQQRGVGLHPSRLLMLSRSLNLSRLSFTSEDSPIGERHS